MCDGINVLTLPERGPCHVSTHGAHVEGVTLHAPHPQLCQIGRAAGYLHILGVGGEQDLLAERSIKVNIAQQIQPS